ncbi:Rha family transcriptional regulator [Rapidithrix thailandica]|uniref:Rha family transcriptional regulator n=1 Tax=Rapidithrix thailandica TaxID=413964 RepID=A0AAW9S531_9BACT
MKELVSIQGEKVLTTSKKVAEKFGKYHKNILRKIEGLHCSSEFKRLNYELSEYTDVRGRKQKEYVLTKDGFVFLVMGFKGEQAAEFKEEYIRAFNHLEEEIKYLYEAESNKKIVNALKLLGESSNPIKEVYKPVEFTIKGYATYYGIKGLSISNATRLGKKATKECKNKGLQIKHMPDPRFGLVNVYPVEVLEPIFEEFDKTPRF